MSEKRSSAKRPDHLRTWIEIDARAARKNYDTFRKLIGKNAPPGKKVQLWAVVKSNAYGHGLFVFSKLLADFGVDGFCVDSLVEGVALRKAGIKKPILVLGYTLPSLYAAAAKNEITITISNFDALRALIRAKHPPRVHFKIDTGMHRQGFYMEDIPRAIAMLKKKIPLTGIFTHFAFAADMKKPAYTEQQRRVFLKAAELFEDAGFKNLTKHMANTGGTLMNEKYHADAVRIGMGLYGLWPSPELYAQLKRKIILEPVLSWRTILADVKPLKKGDLVGYDLTERIVKNTAMGVLPIGYWHGLSRLQSGIGNVIVNGRRARILGRVSMDLAVIALAGRARLGDVVTIIGRDGKEMISAEEFAERSGTNNYEYPTRLNPLMERVVV